MKNRIQHILRISFVLFVFPMLISLFWGCSDSVNNPNSDIMEQNITVSANQSFSFELEVCSVCGYQWNYSISDTSVLQIDSLKYKPKSENLEEIGGITIETFYFTAKTKGFCTINLAEVRNWEVETEPINSVRYFVNCK